MPVARQRALVIGLSLAVLCACSRGGEQTDSPTVPAAPVYEQVVHNALEWYPETDAATRAALEATVPDEELTWEEYANLSDSYVQCLVELGLRARAFEVSVEGRRDFTHSAVVRDHASLTEAEEDSTMTTAQEHCEATVWSAVSSVYVSQPTSMELRTAHIDRYRAPLVECLREAGVEVVDDPTEDELTQAMLVEGDTTDSICAFEVGYFEDPDIPPYWWAEE